MTLSKKQQGLVVLFFIYRSLILLCEPFQTEAGGLKRTGAPTRITTKKTATKQEMQLFAYYMLHKQGILDHDLRLPSQLGPLPRQRRYNPSTRSCSRVSRLEDNIVILQAKLLSFPPVKMNVRCDQADIFHARERAQDSGAHLVCGLLQ